MANEQINIEKLIYGKNSIKDNLDTTFSELTSKAIPIDLQQFFDEYDKLFYDIPEVGINSHTSLMERSRDYLSGYNDPKDREIEDLIEEIRILEDKLREATKEEVEAEEEAVTPEHPYFPNKSFLQKTNSGTYYYMERGKKRKLVDDRILTALKTTNGYSKDSEDFAIQLPGSVIQGIQTGPAFSVEDLDGHSNDAKQIAKQIISLDPREDAAIKGGWPGEWEDSHEGVDGYIKVIEKEIRECGKVDDYLRDKLREYQYEVRWNLDPENREELIKLRTYTNSQKEKNTQKFKKYQKLLEDAHNIKEGVQRDIEIAIEEAEAIAKAERDFAISTFLEEMEDLYEIDIPDWMENRPGPFGNIFKDYRPDWNVEDREASENLVHFFSDMKKRFSKTFTTITQFREFLEDPIASKPYSDYDGDGVNNITEVEEGFDPKDGNETPRFTGVNSLDKLLQDPTCVYYKNAYKKLRVYKVKSSTHNGKLDGYKNKHLALIRIKKGWNRFVKWDDKYYFICLENGKKSDVNGKAFSYSTNKIYNGS
tara:strand:- start:1041 stop:2651 length:1611 start_codon:yes stop_codon:yes gene_type:complete